MFINKMRSLERLTEQLGKTIPLPAQRVRDILLQVETKGAYMDGAGNIYLKDDIYLALEDAEVRNTFGDFLKARQKKSVVTSQAYFTIAEVCNILKVSPKTLKGYRDAGAIGFIKAPKGRRVLFSQEHIDSFTSKNEHYAS